jgi:deoxyribose-phosphate aldolase
MNLVQAVQTLNKSDSVVVQLKPQHSTAVVREDIQRSINDAAAKALEYLTAMLEEPSLSTKERVNIARIILREGAMFKVAASRTDTVQETLY